MAIHASYTLSQFISDQYDGWSDQIIYIALSVWNQKCNALNMLQKVLRLPYVSGTFSQDL
jgi:hypothetical protein